MKKVKFEIPLNEFSSFQKLNNSIACVGEFIHAECLVEE